MAAAAISVRDPRFEQAELLEVEYASWSTAMVGFQAEIERRNNQMAYLCGHAEKACNDHVQPRISDSIRSVAVTCIALHTAMLLFIQIKFAEMNTAHNYIYLSCIKCTRRGW